MAVGDEDPLEAKPPEDRTDRRLRILAIVCVVGAGVLIAIAVANLVGSGSRSAHGRHQASSPSAHPRPAPAGFPFAPIRLGGTADGDLSWCVLVAATPALQNQGLMWVTDRLLSGYDGMLFRWNHDTTETFWMRNTPQPLSIAFFAADGALVSSTNMAPCGDRADCPSYSAAGPYRYALEVPQGQLPLAGPGASLHLTPASTGGSCTPRHVE